MKKTLKKAFFEFLLTLIKIIPLITIPFLKLVIDYKLKNAYCQLFLWCYNMCNQGNLIIIIPRKEEVLRTMIWNFVKISNIYVVFLLGGVSYEI